MTVDDIAKKLRAEFARQGGLARARALSKTRLRQIAQKAGSAKKRKRKK